MSKAIRKSRLNEHELPEALRALVKQSVNVLGKVLHDELGEVRYRQIEAVRQRMASIRKSSSADIGKELHHTFRELEALTADERRAFARAYTLMFELMNACENAYRTDRLRRREEKVPIANAEGIYYVVTAHPTEARSPDNIEIFHRIQNLLVDALQRGFPSIQDALRSHLHIAWKIRIVRYRSPKVADEAEHIYSIILREENLSALLDFGRKSTPVYLRSWVGGDKDGHPGVNEKTLAESLQLSRSFIFRYVNSQLEQGRALTNLLTQYESSATETRFRKTLPALRKLAPGDGRRAKKASDAFDAWCKEYIGNVGPLPLPLLRLQSLFKAFPGLVVPLELREDSSVILSDPTGKTLAIGRMLKKIALYSRGSDPRWYARGMIISMAETLEHVQVTARMVKRIIGNLKVPIVPLFEQKLALENSPKIVAAIIKDPLLGKAIRKDWKNRYQVMLGYSDSSKESGVLASRLAVTDAMLKLDAIFKKHDVQPIFFHGSGGSIDRGGGSILEQIAAWPKSALSNYKATIQGEMVERTFASPEILQSRFAKIAAVGKSASHCAKPSAALEVFSERTAAHYRETIASARFLEMVEKATPYRYLSALKIGSRPSKRGGALSVPALRAIPWVLCWTQTRVLFQTWWGIGTAWKSMSSSQKSVLRREFNTNPLFRSYLSALGFTLAKVELPVWEFYLETSGLDQSEIDFFKPLFREELAETWACFKAITGEKNPVWFRPWLGKSIELRASMIHPLNLLGILAQRDEDLPLVRLTVTGVASGMLTTG